MKRRGYRVNHRRVRRLQKCLNLRTVYPRPRFNTSEPHPEHEKLPYLLHKYKIERSNQVGSTDITYTAVAGRRAFVIGIVDWFSRKVLAYNVVNTMDAFYCVETLKAAIDSYGKPEISNSDQGGQFTSSEFVAKLRIHGIQISIDGQERCLEDTKIERFWWALRYEDIKNQRVRQFAAIPLRCPVLCEFLQLQADSFNTPVLDDG